MKPAVRAALALLAPALLAATVDGSSAENGVQLPLGDEELWYVSLKGSFG